MNMCLELLIIMRLELRIIMTYTHNHLFGTIHKNELCVQKNTWLASKLMIMHVYAIMTFTHNYAFRSKHIYDIMA